jgi:hypothetical protein
VDISQLDPEYRSPDIRVYHIRRRRSTDAAAAAAIATEPTTAAYGHILPPIGAPATLVEATDDIRHALATPPTVTRTSSVMLKRQLSHERKKPVPIEDNTALF